MQRERLRRYLSCKNDLPVTPLRSDLTRQNLTFLKDPARGYVAFDRRRTAVLCLVFSRRLDGLNITVPIELPGLVGQARHRHVCLHDHSTAHALPPVPMGVTQGHLVMRPEMLLLQLCFHTYTLYLTACLQLLVFFSLMATALPSHPHMPRTPSPRRSNSAGQPAQPAQPSRSNNNLSPAQAIARAWRSESPSTQQRWREADAKAKAQFTGSKKPAGKGYGAKM